MMHAQQIMSLRVLCWIFLALCKQGAGRNHDQSPHAYQASNAATAEQHTPRPNFRKHVIHAQLLLAGRQYCNLFGQFQTFLDMHTTL